jgi:hypothetical protein
MSSRTMCAVLALSLVGGCLDHAPLGPGADVVVVHAVLNPTTSVQHVDVRHSAGDAARGIPIHGAMVTLTAPDGTTRVAAEVPGPGDSTGALNFDSRYDLDSGALAVGTPYRLRVVTVDGITVEGDAIVPATPPPQTMTERRFDPATDTLRLAWPRATGARAYEVRIIPQPDSTGSPINAPGGSYYFFPGDSFLAYVDTSVVVAGTARVRGAPVFFPGGRYEVVVSAVDDHYYEYFSHDSDRYTPTALPTSLRGGAGVFGAIVPILRQTIVVEGSIGGGR